MDLQELDKIDTNPQSVSGAENFSSASTLRDTITMIAGNTVFCNRYRAPSDELHIQFVMFDREFNMSRDGKMWMSSSGGQCETQMGDAKCWSCVG